VLASSTGQRLTSAARAPHARNARRRCADHKNSQQLADAPSREQTRIIVTTLQKIPARVVDRIEAVPARRYAVIVDDGHSSQTGGLQRIFGACRLLDRSKTPKRGIL
jgi:type I site-specific restriction-modification system R (restriction) subunit